MVRVPWRRGEERYRRAAWGRRAFQSEGWGASKGAVNMTKCERGTGKGRLRKASGQRKAGERPANGQREGCTCDRLRSRHRCSGGRRFRVQRFSLRVRAGREKWASGNLISGTATQADLQPTFSCSTYRARNRPCACNPRKIALSFYKTLSVASRYPRRQYFSPRKKKVLPLLAVLSFHLPFFPRPFLAEP